MSMTYLFDRPLPKEDFEERLKNKAYEGNNSKKRGSKNDEDEKNQRSAGTFIHCRFVGSHWVYCICVPGVLL